MGHSGDSGDIEDVTAWVADRLAVEGASLWGDLGGPLLKIIGVINEVHRDAELGQRVVEEVVGAAVERR